MKFPQNIIKKLGKKNFNEYKYIIFIVFLLLISFLINRKIDNCKKLTLLFAGLLICIYQPILVVPFLVFLVLIHILIKDNKSQNIETFYTTDDNLSKLENKKLGRNNKSLILDDYQKFRDYISEKYRGNNNDTEDQIKQKQDKKNRAYDLLFFYKSFFDIYFMDINNEKDWNTVNKILEEIDKFDDFIDMSDVSYSEDIFAKSLNFDNTYKNNDSVQKLKKLGLFFYQGDKNNKTIFNQIILILKYTGLYPFYMGIYKGEGVGNIGDYYSKNLYNNAVSKEKEVQNNYEKIKKNIFELGILHYKSICEDMNSDNPEYFKEKGISNLEFEPYLLYNKNYLENILFEDNFNTMNDFFVVRLPSRPKNYKGKKGLLIDEKDSKKLFKVPKFTDKNMLNTSEKLETELSIISREIEDNFRDIKLLDQNFYKIEPNFKIAFNYLTLLYIIHNSKLKEHLDNIKKNNKNQLLKLYNYKKNEFENQIEAEKLSGIYQLTSLDDLFLDNVFFYFQISDEDLGIEKVFPIDYHIEKFAPEETEEEEEEDMSSENDRQQMTYQKKLESDFDSNLLSSLREEQLDKYYSFLDKNKYEAINSLNKLAEAKNEKMRIENQSFSSVVDDFSKSVFDIVDEISKLVKDTLNDNLETFSDSPSESLSHFQKFIIFIKKLSEILMNDKRAIHTGFVLVIIALLIYFIDDRESNCSCQKPNSLLSFLKN